MPTGVGVGDPISFRISAPESEREGPVAKEVALVTGAEAAAVLSGKGAKGKGKGKSKDGKGGGMARPAPPRRDGPTMRMVGLVKKRSPGTGQHMILCQDISDVYGRDGQVPVDEEPEGGLNIGDKIAFDVHDPGEGG